MNVKNMVEIQALEERCKLAGLPAGLIEQIISAIIGVIAPIIIDALKPKPKEDVDVPSEGGTA